MFFKFEDLNTEFTVDQQYREQRLGGGQLFIKFYFLFFKFFLSFRIPYALFPDPSTLCTVRTQDMDVLRRQ